MIEYNVQIDDSAVDKLDGWRRRQPELVRLVLQRLGARMASRTQTEALSGPTTADTLSIRTGRLRNSVMSEILGDSVVVSANTVYAAIHEYGGTITRSRGGKVTIPARRYMGKVIERLLRSGKADELAERTVQEFIRRHWR